MDDAQSDNARVRGVSGDCTRCGHFTTLATLEGESRHVACRPVAKVVFPGAQPSVGPPGDVVDDPRVPVDDGEVESAFEDRGYVGSGRR